MSQRFNAREALQVIEEEGFFSQAVTGIQPPGDALESEEDSSNEFENNGNHLSGKQFLADAEIQIDYGDGTTSDTLN